MKCLIPLEKQLRRIPRHEEDMLYYKLENVRSKDRFYPFIGAYCRVLRIVPMVIDAGLGIQSGQLDLFQPSKIFHIYLRQNTKSLREVEISLYHELIHINLYVIGARNQCERRIERASEILAGKNPGISRVFEEVCPGLSFSLPLRAQLIQVP